MIKSANSLNKEIQKLNDVILKLQDQLSKIQENGQNANDLPPAYEDLFIEE